jgi:hypothetical protein
MRSFDLGISFRFIYIPFMTFNYLRTIEDQVGCLCSVSRHLERDGRLVLELMSFYREWFHDDNIPRLVFRRTNGETGETAEVFRLTRFDPSTQVVEHDRYYRFIDSAGRLKDERTVFWRNRFLLLGEASMLLDKAKLTLDAVWGDYEGGPYTHESQVMILLASKTASDNGASTRVAS